MITIICWVAAVAYVEAVTEILLTGNIFSNQRHWLLNRSNEPFAWYEKGPYKWFICFVAELATCGHCLSVWVAGTIFWALPLTLTDYEIVDYAIKLFFLHRMSNVLHELLSRWFNRIPFNLVITKIENTQSILKDEIGETKNDEQNE
jgi:hypothetical protein